MSDYTLTMMVNGKEFTLSVAPHQTLLFVLREELGLVGARESCGIGICGACTVLVNSRDICVSCLPGSATRLTLLIVVLLTLLIL
jgi:aerobic-type carbon monoxide dehydrogenase small subunit (CoxS/CutS family)